MASRSVIDTYARDPLGWRIDGGDAGVGTIIGAPGGLLRMVELTRTTGLSIRSAVSSSSSSVVGPGALLVALFPVTEGVVVVNVIFRGGDALAGDTGDDGGGTSTSSISVPPPSSGSVS